MSAEVRANAAFRPEYNENIHPEAIRQEIESYLGEYRLQLPIYDYTISYSAGRIRDPVTKESMVDKGTKAIERRLSEWKSINRENAERIGFVKLEEQLAVAKNSDVIVWASPPGPKDEGYGNYGFLYVGALADDEKNPGEKKLAMKAIRVENPTIDGFNRALTALTGIGHDFDRAEKFLDHPWVIPRLQVDLLSTLEDIFHFSPDFSRIDKFKKVTAILQPQIDQFIALALGGTSGRELLRRLHIMENITDDFKKNPTIANIDQWRQLSPEVLARYDHRPEFVAGSCGGSADKSADNKLESSNDIINSLSNLRNLLKDNKSEKQDLKCPSCGSTVHVDPCVDGCPSCGKSHEQIMDLLKAKAAKSA